MSGVSNRSVITSFLQLKQPSIPPGRSMQTMADLAGCGIPWLIRNLCPIRATKLGTVSRTERLLIHQAFW
jgi:hypothetical protein